MIPRHITHVLIDIALKFVRANAFMHHRNIQDAIHSPSQWCYGTQCDVELVCHDGVERIDECAFYNCSRLRRLIMPGVRVIAKHAFHHCTSLAYIECGKLEVIGMWTFQVRIFEQHRPTIHQDRLGVCIPTLHWSTECQVW